MTIILDNKQKDSTPKEFSHLLNKKMMQPKETIEFDLNHLLKDCFDELEMLNELVKLFKLNVLEFMGNVKMHLKTNNLKEVAFSAHKLKAGFAMLKATGMRELIVELETQSKSDRPIVVKELYNIFLKEYPLFEKNLDDELTSLNK
jgi:HPt (histidine-containing phosphotransfer) domain-containing protein